MDETVRLVVGIWSWRSCSCWAAAASCFLLRPLQLLWGFVDETVRSMALLSAGLLFGAARARTICGMEGCLVFLFLDEAEGLEASMRIGVCLIRKATFKNEGK